MVGKMAATKAALTAVCWVCLKGAIWVANWVDLTDPLKVVWMVVASAVTTAEQRVVSTVV